MPPTSARASTSASAAASRPLLGNNRRKIELINILLFSLPGTPIIYYGDEIAMGDNIYLGDRNGVRTPMQWSADRNAGFSRANPQQLYFPIIIDPEYHYESINVENQEQNLSSLLNWMRRVTATRRRFQAFGRGTMEFLTSDNTKVLTFLRRYEEENILVIVNLSRFAQAVELDLHAFAGMRPKEIFSQNPFPKIREDLPYTLTVGPHGHFWLLLEPTAQSIALEGGERPLPLLESVTSYDDLLTANVRSRLQGKILPAYLPTCRWFRSKARTIQRIEVRRMIPTSDDPHASRLLWLDVSYTEGMPETYALPLQILPAEAVKSRRSAAPTSCIASLADGGALCDASADEGFQRDLLALVSQHKSAARRQPAANWSAARRNGPARRCRRWAEDVACRALGVEQSNTSIVYGSEFFLKFYRKVEEGENPDIELTRFLTEQAHFPNVPPYAGQIEFHPADRKKPSEVLALDAKLGRQRGRRMDVDHRRVVTLLRASAGRPPHRWRARPGHLAAAAGKRLLHRAAKRPGGRGRHLSEPRRTPRAAHRRVAPRALRRGGASAPRDGSGAVHDALPAIPRTVHRHADPQGLHQSAPQALVLARSIAGGRRAVVGLRESPRRDYLPRAARAHRCHEDPHSR